MKTILILMDTLQRKMIHAYNPGSEAITPNIDRLAARSVVFDQHYIGSAPCMPARRDILTGRLNFLERNWGPVEPFDITFPALLRQRGVFSHMVTDHYHYTELGGEGYLQQYNTWELFRGQESDPWASRVKDPEMPAEFTGRVNRQNLLNRAQYHTDADYPTPKTFAAAAQWLRDNEGADNFFLQVEVFDPHEPFETTEEFKKLYPDGFEGLYDWPRYAEIGEQETPEAIRHLRNLYMATLTMADKWLGKLLDEMDRQSLWEDTLVIFTSDHGHMLGEHHRTGKNLFHAWNEMAQIPLFVHLPGDERAGERINAVTQNIDLFPTVLQWFGAEKELESVPYPVHGRNLLPLSKGETEKVRDYALYGWFGQPVNITDGQYTYFRAAVPENAPLYWYGSILTTFPRYLGKGLPDGALTAGDYLPWAGMPVYRIDQAAVNRLAAPVMAKMGMKPDPDLQTSRLFDIRTDNDQLHPVADPGLEEKMVEALVETMQAHGAPQEQYARLGLEGYLR